MQGIEYWEQLVKSDTEGTIEKENTIKAFEDGQKDILDELSAFIAQAKFVVDIKNGESLDDSFLPGEIDKLAIELDSLKQRLETL